MLVILILVLLVILWVAYNISHKELSAPAFIFVAPFILMCAIALAFSNMWDFELHWNTFLVIFIGNIAFVLGCAFGDRIAIGKTFHYGTYCTAENVRVVKSWKYILLLLLQVVCYSVKLMYIMRFGTSHGVANTISVCLVYYNNTVKFTTNETISFPSWLSLGLDISTVFGFVCACFLAQQLVLRKKEKKNLILLLVNFVLAIVGGVTSGGRGGSVQVIIAFIMAYLVLYQRKFEWKKSIPFKTILFVVIACVGIVALFCASVTWVGRYEVHLFGRYIANYCGAQIFNLNYWLNNNPEFSRFFGQQTFYPIIEKFASILGISEWADYHVGVDSVYAAGYSTGNVFTTFYSYIMDCGYVGIVIMPIIFGIFSQMVYKFARKSPSKYPINAGMIFYCMIAYSIAFSFFGDKFGSLVFTFNMMKRIMILIVLSFFLYYFDIRGLKIVIRKSDVLSRIRIKM